MSNTFLCDCNNVLSKANRARHQENCLEYNTALFKALKKKLKVEEDEDILEIKKEFQKLKSENTMLRQDISRLTETINLMSQKLENIHGCVDCDAKINSNLKLAEKPWESTRASPGQYKRYERNWEDFMQWIIKNDKGLRHPSSLKEYYYYLLTCLANKKRTNLKASTSNTIYWRLVAMIKAIYPDYKHIKFTRPRLKYKPKARVELKKFKCLNQEDTILFSLLNRTGYRSEYFADLEVMDFDKKVIKGCETKNYAYHDIRLREDEVTYFSNLLKTNPKRRFLFYEHKELNRRTYVINHVRWLFIKNGYTSKEAAIGTHCFRYNFCRGTKQKIKEKTLKVLQNKIKWRKKRMAEHYLRPTKKVL